MFFRKGQEAELDELVKRSKSDQEQLVALEQQLRDLEPEWARLQAECEQLSAQYAAQDYCYDRQVCESFWAARGPSLKARLLEVIVQRDALTAPLVKEIAELKQRIHERHSALSSAFGGWVLQVNQQVPALSAELVGARKRCNDSHDLREVIDIIKKWTDKVLDVSEGATISLLNLGTTVRKLAERGL